jgi:Tfp pilus assembly protein PilF
VRFGLGARRIAFALTALFLAGATARAEMIVDSAGQTIDSALDEQVSEARELRMEKLTGFDVDKSIAMLEAITRDNPNYFRAWYNLALSYLKRDSEDTKPALEAFQKAADIQAADPAIHDGSLYNSYGWTLLNAREYDAAEKNLLRGVELQDANSEWTNSALNYNLGRLYFERGDFVRAEDFLTVAITRYGNPAAVDLKAILDKTKK